MQEMNLIGQKTPEQKAQEAQEKAQRITMKERALQIAITYMAQIYSPEEKKKANLLVKAEEIYQFLNK